MRPGVGLKNYTAHLFVGIALALRSTDVAPVQRRVLAA
jgi:hypothetical protein